MKSKPARMLVLILVSILPFLASLLYFLPKDPPPYFMALIGLTKAFLFFAPFLLWSVLKIPDSWKSFPRTLFSKNIGRQIVIGICVGLVMTAAVLGSFYFISDERRAEALSRIAQKISTLKIREHFYFYAFLMSVVHSLLEEFYWRFFIFSAWKSALGNRAFSALPHFIAGLAFTLHHFTVTVFYFDLAFGLLLGLGVLGAGLIWTYIFEKERSLLGVWISHIIVDIALMSVGIRALAL
jgi:membrane protease YdiL (CAAX protease family)